MGVDGMGVNGMGVDGMDVLIIVVGSITLAPPRSPTAGVDFVDVSE